MKLARLNSRNRIAGPKPPPEPLKLDFGCGKSKREGFKGVDCIAFPGVDFVVDLRKPWPWPDSSVAEAHCSHTLEHFDPWDRVHFLNELWRVLVPGGKCQVIVPHWCSCRAYGDPSHSAQPISEFAFYYWKREWRLSQAPHTDIQYEPRGFKCDFEVTWGYAMQPAIAARNQEYQQHAMSFFKEAITDTIATLVALKPVAGNGA